MSRSDITARSGKPHILIESLQLLNPIMTQINIFQVFELIETFYFCDSVGLGGEDFELFEGVEILHAIEWR